MKVTCQRVVGDFHASNRGGRRGDAESKLCAVPASSASSAVKAFSLLRHDGHLDGLCFVFDRRVVVLVNAR